MSLRTLADSPLFAQVPCPVCLSDDHASFLSVPFRRMKDKASLDYSVLGIGPDTLLNVDRCKRCGFVFVNPRVKPESAALLYNKCKTPQQDMTPRSEADSPRKRMADTRKRLSYSSVLFKLIALAPRDRPLRVLDFGAGFGHSLFLARALGLDGFGIELDQFRVARCQGLGLEVHLPEEFERAFPGFTADIILVQAVLEHLTDPRGLFQTLQGYCRPGTVVYMNSLTPRLIINEKKQGAYNKAHFIEHLNYFTPRNLDLLAAEFGFVPAKTIPLFVDRRAIKVPQRAFDLFSRYFLKNGVFQRYFIYSGASGAARVNRSP